MALINIEEFVLDYDETQVFYGKENQRREVWDVETTGNFIESVTRGWAELTTIVVADLNKCLRHSSNVGCQPSIKTFEERKEKGERRP